MNWPLTVAVVLVLAVVLAIVTGRGDPEGSDAEVASPPADVEDAAADVEDGGEAPTEDADPAEPGGPQGDGPVFAAAPTVPDGAPTPEATAAVDRVVASAAAPDVEAITALGETADPRLLWVLSDVLRLARDQQTYDAATDAAAELSGLDLRDIGDFAWGPLTDHLIAWDLPAFEGYDAAKAGLYTTLEPRWQPFFDDAGSDIDWRLVSWGGVLIDDRPLGDPNPCAVSCIPSLDDPLLVPAEEGDYYPDDGIVFGVRIGEEAVAFPRNMMEIHEMVNATIGGRRVAMPYCTLCGAAQVFLTDVEGGGTGEIVMRTSGLLRRSNKVMYDLTTMSVFDTFTGEAVSGPLREAEVALQQAPVVTTTWAAWRDAHPDTTIVARDGGIGRSYPEDPLRGRDDDGPIFPIGERDDRLGVHDPVLGVVLGDGTPLAFDVEAAQGALARGEVVALGGVEVRAEAGGLIAVADDDPVASHQAFWFAWSQFHPDTLLWEG